MRTMQVYRHMSVCTQSIERDQSLGAADELMRRYRIHHLPVLDHGVLVGVVTDRDLRFFESLRDVDTAHLRVEDAMTKEPFFVAPDASVREVAKQMSEHKLGSAVVMDGSNVVGIFTTTDALRALVSVLDDAQPAPLSRRDTVV
jgi:acetoin utilization protein AcuB